MFYVVAGQEIDVLRADDGLGAKPELHFQRIQPVAVEEPQQEQKAGRAPRPRKLAPKDENPIAIDLRQSLERARQLLKSRELEQAKDLLDGVRFDESNEEQRKRVENARAMHHYVEGFWNAVQERAKSLESNTDFKMSGSDRAFVVEAPGKSDRLTLRIRGENKTCNILDVPSDAAAGLADMWLAKDDPNSKVFIAAFLAVDSPDNMGAVRQMLNDAKAAGSDAAQTVLDAIEN